MVKKEEWLLTFPSLMWLLLFFLIPMVIVFAYAFHTDMETLWTRSTLILMGRTLLLSTLTTAFCVALALPVGYELATLSKKWRHLLLLMIVMPFWSSFLIRIFAWKTLLHPEGFVKGVLEMLHIVNPSTTLLYNSWATLLVMVYTYVPFAILPLYAASSKFNFQLMEAAMDLGASRKQAFFKIFLPGIRKGILNACVMVFVPAIGAYVIPDLVGGTNSEMIGNRIARRTLVDHNLPQASALSALLALIILIPLMIGTYLSTRSKTLEAVSRE